MRIIPAIDLIDGKCVRLSQGDYNRQRTYSESPLDMAKTMEDAGIQYLHLVDLDGARLGKTVHWNILENIANNTNLQVDFGGGLKTSEDLRQAFESGARQVVIGSVSVQNPERVENWGKEFGFERIILAADVHGKKVATHGWMETSDLELATYISNFSSLGFRYFLCTDIARDGMLNGPAFELYEEIIRQSPKIKLLASGGIRNIGDLTKLREMGLDGAILGKAIYEGKISMNELAQIC